MKTLIYAVLVVLLPAAGCAPRVAGGGGSGSPSLVKIFTRDDGSTLYFAGPVFYNEVSGDGKIEMDFTLNKPLEGAGTVTCNFTLSSKSSATFTPEKLVLNGDGELIFQTADFKKLFSEKRKKLYRYRYSTEIGEKTWIGWMKSDTHEFTLNDKPFKGGKKHKKHRSQINDQIIFPINH